MSYDEDEEVGAGFKMSDDDSDDEMLDTHGEDSDFGLDEEDPDKDR